MTSLFAWLWQGVLLAALVDLLLRVTPRVNAATRHAIWWVALLGIASIPLAGYVPDGLLHLASGTAAMPPSAGVVNSGGLIELPRLPDWIPAVLLGLWGVTVLRGAARLWKGIVAIRRLESGSHPMPEARQARLPSWTTWRSWRSRAPPRGLALPARP